MNYNNHWNLRIYKIVKLFTKPTLQRDSVKRNLCLKLEITLKTRDSGEITYKQPHSPLPHVRLGKMGVNWPSFIPNPGNSKTRRFWQEGFFSFTHYQNKIKWAHFKRKKNIYAYLLEHCAATTHHSIWEYFMRMVSSQNSQMRNYLPIQCQLYENKICMCGKQTVYSCLGMEGLWIILFLLYHIYIHLKRSKHKISTRLCLTWNHVTHSVICTGGGLFR